MRLVVAATTLFAICAFGGFAFTAFPAVTMPDWWLFPALRVGAQLGSGAFLGLSVARLGIPRRHLVSFAVCTTIGALLCLNPILDLVEGPVTFEGELAQDEVWHGRRSTGVEITVRRPDGAVLELSPVGIHTNRWEEMDCRRSRLVSITALRRLDVVIECHGIEHQSPSPP